MFQLNGFKVKAGFPLVDNLCLHSWHKLIRYNKIRYSGYENHLFQMIYLLVSSFLAQMDRRGRSRCAGSWTLSQRRRVKTKVRQVLSKHQFTGFCLSQSFFVTTLTSRSPAAETESQSVVAAPRAGEQRGYKSTVSVCCLYLAEVKGLLVRGLALRSSLSAAPIEAYFAEGEKDLRLFLSVGLFSLNLWACERWPHVSFTTDIHRNVKHTQPITHASVLKEVTNMVQMNKRS